jgi:L-lactate dehydrogenase complex protein LldG
MNPAHDQILRSVRENLASDPSSPCVPPVPRSPSPQEHPSDLVERFTTQLEAVDAQWTLVRGEVEAARALRRILADVGAKRVAGSDAPLVARLLPERLTDLSREELFACDAGVTTAQWGIAETGTLVLESACERSRLVSLVPPMHVALLSTARLCPSLSDALARVDRASHAITFITGPSRTSDIELTLVVGVHGPQTVHVLLLEEEER